MAGTTQDQQLDAELRNGSHESVTDAAGRKINRDAMPVGVVPPGKTLVQFWHLNFPIGHGEGMPDYGSPIVRPLLTDMLSVRRLSPGSVCLLTRRIQETMVGKLGAGTGGMMAAMLISRCQDAINTPESFPPLLDDDELMEAYKTATRLKSGFQAGVTATGGIKAAGAKAGTVETMKAVAGWLQRLSGVFDRTTTAKGSSFAFIWTGFMAGRGAAYFSQTQLDYRDDINRRHLILPKVF